MSTSDIIQALTALVCIVILIWYMRRPSVVQLKAPPEPVQLYVCVRHWPVEITYACKGQHVLAMITGEEAQEHTHTAVQHHHTENFQRDDITNPEMLANCRSIKVLEPERRYYQESNVRLVNQGDQLVVVPNGADRNSFLAGFTRSHADAMRFVATGDATRLHIPWKGAV